MSDLSDLSDNTPSSQPPDPVVCFLTILTQESPPAIDKEDVWRLIRFPRRLGNGLQMF